MKKILKLICLIILSALFAFPLGACSKNKEDFSDTYNAETDYNPFCVHQQYSTFTEDGSYFCTKEGFLYFQSKDSIALPLCNKADCLHDKEVDADCRAQCFAYFPSEYTSCSYQNEIYLNAKDPYTMEDVIWEIDPETVQRKVLYRMDMGGWLDQMVAHRGYLYFAVRSGNTAGDVTTKFYRLNLKEEYPKPEHIFSTPKDEGIDTMACYGKYLYVTTAGLVNNMQLWQYNLQSGELKQIYSDDTAVTVVNGGYWNGRLLINVLESSDSKEHEIFSMKIDGSDMQPFETKEPIDASSELWTWNDYLMKFSWNANSSNITIYDAEQNEVAHTVDPNCGLFTFTPYGLFYHNGAHWQDINYLSCVEIRAGTDLVAHLVYEGSKDNSF